MSNTGQPNHKVIPIQKALFLFVGKAIPIIVLFFISILYSRKLSYEDYGKFQSLWMYTNLLNVIISFGFTSLLLSSNLSTLAAFVKRHLKKIIPAYAGLLILTVLVFLLYVNNINLATKGLLIAFVMIQSISLVWETLLIKLHKEQIVLLINFIYSLFFFAWHYFILMNEFSLNNLIRGIIIISIIKFIAMLLLNKKRDIKSEPVNDKLYFKHWTYLGLNDITGVLSRWIDKLLLVYLLTPADFAVFFNGSFEIPLFALMISVVGSVMLIEMSRSASSGEKVIQLFIESFRLLSIIVFPLFLFLFFFRTELFAVIFKHKYDASIQIFLISIFIILVRINNYGSILQYYQKGNKIMAGSLLDICMAIILMICLYPLLGTRGVALAIVIATYCQVWYYLLQSAKVLNTNVLSFVPLKSLVITFVIMLTLYACLYYVLFSSTDTIRLLAGVFATILVIAFNLYLYFSKKRSINYGLITKA